jgi:mannose-6-phosphate isomerase
MELTPLLFEPYFSPKVWGGRLLEKLGKRLPEGAIGESWELYDDAQGSARVAQGPAAGLTLRRLCDAWGEALLGPGHAAWARRFPLLIKLIDASQDLSVQVHPDDALALELEGPGDLGKSEAWVVLEARPGARLLSGFLHGVDEAGVKQGLQAGDLEGLLRRESVSPGDAFDIPAGRVHAIGAGCLLAEDSRTATPPTASGTTSAWKTASPGLCMWTRP